MHYQNFLAGIQIKQPSLHEEKASTRSLKVQSVFLIVCKVQEVLKL